MLESLHEFSPDRKIPIIFGGFKDKNTFECLELLEPLAEYFVFLPLATEFRPSWSGEELREMLKKISSKEFFIASNPAKALELSSQNSLRIVCGSLYLAGEFLALLVPKQEVLNI